MKKGSLLNERRAGQRVKVEAVAFVFQKGKLKGFYQVENLSESGIALGGRSALRKGDSIDLVIQLSGRPGIRMLAEVVHCSKEPIEAVYIVGLKFVELDQKTRSAINEAVKLPLKKTKVGQSENAADISMIPRYADLKV